MTAHDDRVTDVQPKRETARAPTAPPEPASARRADARFMGAHPAHWLALGFGSGLSPVAPGTAGTLWAWLAWWAGTVTARHLRTADPSAIVIDEVVAFWLVLWLLLPAGFWAQAVAFALFRFFDAIKPGPVGWADRLLHGRGGWAGGFGILLDDLVAAFCTLLVIALWRAG